MTNFMGGESCLLLSAEMLLAGPRRVDTEEAALWRGRLLRKARVAVRAARLALVHREVRAAVIGVEPLVHADDLRTMARRFGPGATRCVEEATN